jgi:putative hydrolase of the HAD superfamily
MESIKKSIKVVAFDADDTLWDNEVFFREAEDRFAALFEDFLPYHAAQKELLKVEMQNITLYGYGIKAFMLSMIEAALEITSHNVKPETINKIIAIGKEMLDKPVTLLDGVENVLQQLYGKYRLVVATKGDLLDQERKLKKSKLLSYFHHIEVMTEKADADFDKLIKHLDIAAGEFFMPGNSLKSDVLPVLNLGGHAAHIPYHTTWVFEKIDHEINHPHFYQFSKIDEILPYLI